MAAVAPTEIDGGSTAEPDDDEMIVDNVEPEPDDPAGTGDRIELVRTGLVRIWIGDVDRYRIRRPFFGEFKTLRLAIEDMNDEIQTESDKLTTLTRRIVEEAQARPDGETPTAFAEWQAESRRATTTATRRLTEMAEDYRIEWWDQMWGLLSVDGKPDDWPAWVTDPNIGNRIMSHWRSSPLGRG